MFPVRGWGMVAVGVIIAMAVSYHFYSLSDLQARVTTLTEEAGKLRESNERLTASNASLEDTLKQQREINGRMLQENANLRKADEAARARLASSEQRILSAENRARAAALREGAGSERLLGAINRDTQCRMAHIMEEGECVAGQWRPGRGPR